MTNKSHQALDSRSLLRILYEKATFGAVPTHFKIDGHDYWHPVQFVENRLLTALTFSDGTTHFVSDDARAFDLIREAQTTEQPKSQEVDRMIWPEDQTDESVKSNFYNERRDENTIQDMESDLAADVTENMTEEARPIDDPTPGAASAADWADVEPVKDPVADSLNSLLRPASAAPSVDSDTASIASKFKPRGHA